MQTNQTLWQTGLVLFFLLSAWACGGRTLTGISQDGAVRDGTLPDHAVLPDRLVPEDHDVPPDAGPWCGQPGDAWKAVDVPITDIQVLTSEAYPDRIPEGVAIRIMAHATLGGCDKEGPISWGVDPANRVITVQIKKWQYLGNADCPQDAWQVTRYAVLPAYSLDRGPWTVTTATGPNPLSSSFRIGRCPWGDDCQCQSGGGTGQTGDPCRYDCECSYPAVCVHDGFQAPSPDSGECGTVCNSDGDCRDDEHCRLDGDDQPNGVCERGRVECTSSEQCPLGYACLPGYNDVHVCQPIMNAGLRNTPCVDDCACAPGFECIDVGNGTKQCEIPCLSQSDCPEMLCCGMWMPPELYTGPTCDECMDASGSSSAQ